MIVAASLAATLYSGATRADPFQDGVAAEARGDAQGALTLYRQAADRGDAAAQYSLGRLYRQGQGAPKDDAAALLWFRKAAEQGNPGAAYSLGQMYHVGEGLRRDDRQAACWFLKAAQEDYAAAEMALGGLFAKGEGVPKDADQALTWYRKAAEQGDVEGEVVLALTYLDLAREPSAAGGVGVPRERFAAMMDSVFGAGKWRETGGYRSPAEENVLRAEGALTVPAGRLSYHSLGTPEAPGAYDVVVAGLSPEMAAVELRRSGVKFRRLFPEGLHGDQGPHLHVEPEAASVEAMAFHFPGSDSPASTYEEALGLLRRAALQGSAEAEYDLGQMYEKGLGTSRNAAIAGYWYLKAAAGGETRAQAKASTLHGGGTPTISTLR